MPNTVDSKEHTLTDLEELQAENDALREIISSLKHAQDELNSIIIRKDIRIAYLSGLVKGIENSVGGKMQDA